MRDRCPCLGLDFTRGVGGQCALRAGHWGDHEFITPSDIDRLEHKVEVACWPSDMERHHIAIALVAAAQDNGRTPT